jgi:hypothetical protein
MRWQILKKNTEDEYKKDLVARIEKIRADIDKMVSSEGRNACNQELLNEVSKYINMVLESIFPLYIQKTAGLMPKIRNFSVKMWLYICAFLYFFLVQ